MPLSKSYRLTPYLNIYLFKINKWINVFLACTSLIRRTTSLRTDWTTWWLRTLVPLDAVVGFQFTDGHFQSPLWQCFIHKTSTKADSKTGRRIFWLHDTNPQGPHGLPCAARPYAHSLGSRCAIAWGPGPSSVPRPCVGPACAMAALCPSCLSCLPTQSCHIYPQPLQGWVFSHFSAPFQGLHNALHMLCRPCLLTEPPSWVTCLGNHVFGLAKLLTVRRLCQVGLYETRLSV